MATVGDIINAATQRLRIQALGEELSANEAEYCLDEYNQMLHAWEIDGINLAHLEATLDDEIDAPDSHLEAIKLSLCERIADAFGKEMSIKDRQLAEEGRSALRAYHFSIGELGSDHPLSRPRGC